MRGGPAAVGGRVAWVMGSPDGRQLELFGAVKSWMPRRGEHSPPPASGAAAAAEPHDLSRDFWMPDQSCRVCYDCDAQFTILNRRHHCRHCGRVFCARCTANSVPRSPGDAAREDGERIRVCNYCFKRWLEEEAAARRDSAQPSSPVLSVSPSAASVGSDKSTSTRRSSAGSNGQMSSYANGSFTGFASAPVHGEGNCSEGDGCPEKQQPVMESVGGMEPEAYAENPSDPFNFSFNRYAFVLCSLRKWNLTCHIPFTVIDLFEMLLLIACFVSLGQDVVQDEREYFP
jgi:1-phosphatidylinositol-3-phosphate 5-kinase